MAQYISFRSNSHIAAHATLLEASYLVRIPPQIQAFVASRPDSA
jgi:hypothetical protein